MDHSDYASMVKRAILDINAWIRNRSEELSIPCADPYPRFADGRGILRSEYAAGDNAHLNVEGQRLLARTFYEGYLKDAEGLGLLVCLGDSHTQGHPMRTDVSRNGIPIDPSIDSADNYPYFLSEMTGAKVINRGIAGNTVYGMLNRFSAEVLPHYPDHCIVLGGTNDALIGTHPEDTMEDLERLYKRCMDAGIVPVSSTIVPIGF